MKKTIICLMIALSLFLFSSMHTGVMSVSASTVNKNKKEEVLNLSAKSGYLIDYNTGKVLFEKNSKEELPIASMTKLATLAIVFDSIDKGVLKLNDEVVVSQNASKVGGSSAFLDAGSKYKVSELIKSVIVASANDSSVALAEHLSGTEELFVLKMNKLASDLKLENTHFKNCTGLPADDHYSSAYDMAIIYKQICNNENYKKYSKLWMDDFMHPSGRRTGLVNTNKLIKSYEGLEGGKTGYTDKARFCLTASARRGNMRLIGVVIGANDSKTRFNEMTRLFNYGFSNFDNKVVANQDVPVAIESVQKTEQKVEIYPKNNVIVLIDKNDNKTFTTDYKLNVIKAPIKANDVVGKLFVFDENNMVIDEVDLIVKKDVTEISFKERLRKLVNVW